MSDETVTPEQIAKNYSASLDSVNLINAGRPVELTLEEWHDTVQRNKEHLHIMIAKDFWTTEDLAPLIAAAE